MERAAVNTGNVINRLKDMIDREGQSYLTEEPYRVYLELKEDFAVDKIISGGILVFLVNGMMDYVGPESDFQELSRKIQKECGFNKKMADRLAGIFLSLYSEENMEEWESKNLKGLSEFLSEEFCCSWEGEAVWERGGGGILCHYQGKTVLKPKETAAKEKKLQDMLRRNSFLTKEEIAEHFEGSLRKYLDDAFEEECTCDEYYPPVVEDFELEYFVGKWCKEKGFELLFCEGRSWDDGYEPHSWRRW